MIDLETRKRVEVKAGRIAGSYIAINTQQARRIVNFFRRCNIAHYVSWALNRYQDSVIYLEPGSNHQIQHLLDQLDDTSPIPPTYLH